MMFSYKKKKKIQEEVIKVGREGMKITENQRMKIINELLGRVKVREEEESKSSEIFEKNGSGRYTNMFVPTAEFITNSGKQINSADSQEYNNLKLNTFNFENDMIVTSGAGSEKDFMRNTMMGMMRERVTLRRRVLPENNPVFSFQKRGRNRSNDRFFKNNSEREKMHEVIIQKLH